jgi:hypothetical protein
LHCLVLLLPVGSLHSQTPAPDAGNGVTTIKTRVRLVLVDVVVTNGRGEAVTGLHKEDFEILEDGKQLDWNRRNDTCRTPGGQPA